MLHWITIKHYFELLNRIRIVVEGENRLLMLTIKSYLLLQDDLLETEVAGENAAELRDDLDRDEAVSYNVGILDLPLPRSAGASALGVSCSSSGLSESVQQINFCSLEMENAVIKSVLKIKILYKI